jgi:glycine oxidase
MLSPGAEWSVEDARLGDAMRDARSQWPAFAHEISLPGAASVTVHEVGSLFFGWDNSDRREWQRHLDVIAQQGIVATPVSRVSDAELFAPINPRISSGAFVSDDAYVDPDEVMAALLSTAQAIGVNVELSLATRCRSDASTVLVETGGRVIRARCGIVATGAVPAIVDHVSAHNHVRPIRGVTLRLAEPPRARGWMVRAIVGGQHIYVIARTNGSILVGSTSDESSESVVEARHVRQLLADATTVVPGLDDTTFVEARVGLRPAPDSHHSFFEILGTTRWAWSSGHFRHGFLLAPLAATSAREFATEVLQ